MNTQTQSPIPASGQGNRTTPLHRVAVAAALVAAAYILIPSQPTTAGADAATPLAHQHRMVGQAQAAAGEARRVQYGSGMPALSATATEGNVVDMTY